MILKIYALVWIIGLLMAGLFYLLGELTPVIQIIFGFLTFGTLFMGILFVLPTVTKEQQH
jgi:hypothetical protein